MTYAQADKRGGGKQIVSMDDQLIEAEAAMLTRPQGDETNGYDHQWAANLVRRAWDQFHRAMVAEGKRELIEALKPFVVGGSVSPPSQEQTAAQLRMPISTFRNSLRRLRQRYRESIRAEVASTVSNARRSMKRCTTFFECLLS